MGRPDQGAVHRAAQWPAVCGEVRILSRGISYNTQHLTHDTVDYWRNQGYSALHHHQEQFDNAAQEHQQVAYASVQTAVALNENDFQIQGHLRIMLKRTSVSNKEDYCPKLFSSQLRYSKPTDTLIHDATTEMLRRDTHRNLCEETRTANASMAPEDARLNDVMNQIRSARESLYTTNLLSAQQLLTSKFELSRAQTKVSHLRSSVERNQPTETHQHQQLTHKQSNAPQNHSRNSRSVEEGGDGVLRGARVQDARLTGCTSHRFRAVGIAQPNTC